MNSSKNNGIGTQLKHLQGITIVAILMVLFGLAEIMTGFTHNFIGVVATTATALSTIIGAMLGAFYFLGGILIFTKRKWAAIVALVLLAGDILGRIAMVLTGLFPVDSFAQTFSIVIGTAIAIFFFIFIGLKWKAFR